VESFPRVLATIVESEERRAGPKLGTPLEEGPLMGPAPGTQGFPQAAQGYAQGHLRIIIKPQLSQRFQETTHATPTPTRGPCESRVASGTTFFRLIDVILSTCHPTSASRIVSPQKPRLTGRCDQTLSSSLQRKRLFRFQRTWQVLIEYQMPIGGGWDKGNPSSIERDFARARKRG